MTSINLSHKILRKKMRVSFLNMGVEDGKYFITRPSSIRIQEGRVDRVKPLTKIESLGE